MPGGFFECAGDIGGTTWYDGIEEQSCLIEEFFGDLFELIIHCSRIQVVRHDFHPVSGAQSVDDRGGETFFEFHVQDVSTLRGIAKQDPIGAACCFYFHGFISR